MRYTTHMTTSICAGIGVAMVTSIPLSSVFLSGVLIGSLLPDIDEPESFIGKRSAGTSHIVKSVFGHRGFTHSLVCAALVALLYLFFSNYFVLGIACGYLFHIAGDFFSVSGVPLFHPLVKEKFAVPLYKTGGIREKVLFFLSVVLLGFLVYQNFFLFSWAG